MRVIGPYVCAVMLRGRHRGLPVAIDRAVVMPFEFRNDSTNSMLGEVEERRDPVVEPDEANEADEQRSVANGEVPSEKGPHDPLKRRSWRSNSFASRRRASVGLEPNTA